jgi:hypothetical protein
LTIHARSTDTTKAVTASTARFWGLIIKGTGQAVSIVIIAALLSVNVKKAGKPPCLLSLPD